MLDQQSAGQDCWIIVANGEVQGWIPECPERGTAVRIAEFFLPEVARPNVIPWKSAISGHQQAAQKAPCFTRGLAEQMGLVFPVDFLSPPPIPVALRTPAAPKERPKPKPDPPPAAEHAETLRKHFQRPEAHR